MKTIYLLLLAVYSQSLIAQINSSESRFSKINIESFHAGKNGTSNKTMSTICSPTLDGTIYSVFCSDIGTAGFTAKTQHITIVNGSTASNSPSNYGPNTDPSCGTYSTSLSTESWYHYDLDTNVTQVTLSYGGGGTAGSGFNGLYVAMYQGTSCSNLTLISCNQLVGFSMGTYLIYNVQTGGLDPDQDLYMFFWTPSNQTYNFDYSIIGTSTEPLNSDCSQSVSSPTGCNVGAMGDTFTTPGNGGISCSGGNWGSNENTVYYSVMANSTSGSISINNIVCNEGTSGNAQFGLWTSCACIGTYTAPCFKGCAVGSGSITLSGLVPGQIYFLAVDGFAGDMCKWDFVTSGVTVNTDDFDQEVENTPLVIFDQSSGSINIRFDKNHSGNYRIALLNTLGQAVIESKEISLSGSEEAVNLSAGNLKNNMYIVKITNTKTLNTYTTKIININ